MTALLIALFAGAGILAVLTMVASITHYAAKVAAITRQYYRGGGKPGPEQRKHLLYARRLKPQPGWRAKARARRTKHDLRCSERILASHGPMHGHAAHKSVRNQHSGFIMAHLTDTLATE